ncbi:cell division protein FtsX [Chryseobacterium caseinilyticum]|uniref:Cell division protein FtsX n=1 Tax=Chryseobacterium caseinilyticum TaxID=2771428 RepID=A0ABR8ZC89_9FLAO|nr:permease-like cell division protein FtsX [Chryseobacterium caseinilyticum]MBD8082709.1 ABC transporter permease [Chryseobacterium caseinilyticum]
MARTADDFNKNRLRSSNITVVVSIALVLFLLGLMGLIVINAKKYSDYLKEQLVVNAFFDQNYDPKDSLKIAKNEQEALKKIETIAAVKKAVYISRDRAVEEARKSMGVNTSGIFEENIFPASVEVTIKPEFTDSLKINEVLKQLRTVPGIVDVNNDTDAQKVYTGLNKVLKWILGFSLIFLILAIVLINNSIRLKIFSRRFIIKTMQLVGAKRRFILIPFIKESIILGLIGAAIGLLAVSGIWYFFTRMIEMPFVQDTTEYFWLALGVLFVGIFISIISTVIATWRFLKSNVDDLYYS